MDTEPVKTAVQIDPNVWGPPLWDLLFTLSFKSTAKATAFQSLFALLDKVIPCQHCRRSYVVYRKEVRPTTYIRQGVDHAAAQWLWTIHDMVNQKLGKICISYEALKKRHASTTLLTNDFLLVDLLAMMQRAVPNEHVYEFARIVIPMTEGCDGLRARTLCDDLFQSDRALADDIYTLYGRLCELHGIDPSTRDAFDARIALSHA